MNRQTKLIVIVGVVLVIGACAVGGMITMGSGLTMFALSRSEADAAAVNQPRRAVTLVSTETPTPVMIPTNTTEAVESLASAPTEEPIEEPIEEPTEELVAEPTEPATLVPTWTPTVTPIPTETPTSTPLPPPTSTPPATDTPVPQYGFAVAETASFPTSHANFDVYVAIVNEDNDPLAGYKVIGTHSGGMQVESAVSAPEWVANSGAMHYKAGNIKYEVPNSPGGAWSLQLVDEAGNPVAESVAFPFDPSDPSWHFVIFSE